MAELGSIELKLGGIPDQNLRKILLSIFQTFLRDIRFGRAVSDDAAQNLGGGFFSGVTAAVADTEFSVLHSIGRPPYLLIPVLPLTAANARIVPLTVTRAADSQRVYLSSAEENAAFSFYLEG